MHRQDPQHYARLTRLAAGASVATAVAIALAKILAVALTGSLAVLASLADSLADITASAVTWFSVRVAVQPPDRHHRFGHGKAEALSALAQAALVGGAAIYLAAEATARLLHPRPVAEPWVGVAVMAFALVLTVALLLLQRAVIRRTGSRAISADSLHYRTDLVSNGLVLLSLVAMDQGLPVWLDPLVALALAAWLGRGALRIGRSAVDELMDRELPEPFRQRILAIARRFPEVRGVHDLRTRRSGQTVFVEMHAEFDPEMPLRAAHEVTERIERAIRAEVPGAVVVVHQEPAGLEEERLDHLVARAESG